MGIRAVEVFLGRRGGSAFGGGGSGAGAGPAGTAAGTLLVAGRHAAQKGRFPIIDARPFWKSSSRSPFPHLSQ